jgi:uncharacterized protein (DUF2141 family)
MRSSLSMAVGPLLAAFVAAAAPAQADSLVVELSGVRSASGTVVVSLCGDAAAAFPGKCRTYTATSPAAAGKVSVRIDNVKAGRYALQAFHDENSNGVPEAPPEGYAFGNDSPWPTTFQAAIVAVAGSAKIAVKMQYVPTGFGG